MRSASFVVVVVATFVVAALAGCSAPPVVSPPPPYIDPCEANVCLDTRVTNKADILFVLDDGPTMATKLATWRASLPAMLDSFAQLAAGGLPVSLHFGVVTSDLGAGPNAIAARGCKPGGDGAKLRAGAGMTGGVRFIDDNLLDGTSNVSDVAAALAAITDVGTSGCDFRQPLEAAYRALHDFMPENAGFLRPDALLVVVFVTDADDCSTPPATDLFDDSAAGVAAYGPLDRFRCTQFGIECNGMPVPPMSTSGLAYCTSLPTATGGKLLDVDRYIGFFTRPAAQGGVKVDPDEVVLAALAAPRDPMGVHIATPCTDDATAAMCPTLDHSCVSPSDPSAFGDPAVRLRIVVDATKNHRSASICDSDDSGLMKSLLPINFEPGVLGCFTGPLAIGADGSADCIVLDVTANADGSTSSAEIPSCMEAGGAFPCWELVDRLPEYDGEGCMPSTAPPVPTCRVTPECQPVTWNGIRQLYTLRLHRDTPPARGTSASAHCARPSS